MLFPTKHTRMAQSLFGLGGFILGRLSKPKSIDSLWTEFNSVNNSSEFPAFHTFDNFILATDFLYCLNLIKLNSKGELTRETRKSLS